MCAELKHIFRYIGLFIIVPELNAIPNTNIEWGQILYILIRPYISLLDTIPNTMGKSIAPFKICFMNAILHYKISEVDMPN